MSKTVELQLNENVFTMLSKLAISENRTLANFIETSVLNFVEQSQFVDEFEMSEIKNNKSLIESLNQGLKDAKTGSGRFVN